MSRKSLKPAGARPFDRLRVRPSEVEARGLQPGVRPLWTCPKCGARFVTAHMWHSCGRFTVRDLFAKSDRRVLSLFRKFRRMVQSCGPTTMIPQKTRLVFMVRMRFAGVSPRKSWLQVAMILPRQLPDDPRLRKIERFAPRSFGHYFRIDDPDQLDGGMQAWLCEAYRRGTQETLFVD